MSRPLLSVIVPTYGRWQHIGPLLDSVLAQEFDDWECVIAEDASPNQERMRRIVTEYADRTRQRVQFHANAETLGYDANFRKLVELAKGRFLFVMGDDDFVAPGAFKAVARAAETYPNMGVILRAFAVFQGTPDNIVQVNRYYADECRFPAGPEAIVACYRRLVAMSGLVIHRDLAQAAATDRWDGTLFYQHWIAANVLVERDAVYVPELLAYFRRGGTPIFGTAKREKELYTPGRQPPDTDLRMVGSLMAIAEAVERERGVKVAGKIRRDFANYMYPTIAHQAHEPWPVFYKFYRDLGRLGFNSYLAFHAWFWAVAILGAGNVDRMIQWIRRTLGHTPNLSRFALPRT